MSCFLHLIYFGETPLDALTRDLLGKRVLAELATVSSAKGAFFVLEHVGDVSAEELGAFKPNDVPIYLMRSEDSRAVKRLAKRHQPSSLAFTDDQIQALIDVVAGGTGGVDGGMNTNFDENGVRKGVSFIPVGKLPQSPQLNGRYFGELVLHEFGHQFLDPSGGTTVYHNPQHNTSIMDAKAPVPGQAERHYTQGERVRLKAKVATLPK